MDLFFDEQISYGAGWQAKLEEELTNSDGILVLVGLGLVSGWSKAELEVAITRQVKESAFRIIPFLLPGSELNALPLFLNRFQAYKFTVDPLTASAEYFATLSLLLGLRQPPEKAESPFPGLESFDESLAPYFFGRHKEIEELTRLATAPRNGRYRWIQLEGGSGSGKSSLAKAGLVPAMRPLGWKVGIMRPGARPLRSLAQAVYSALNEDLSEKWSLDKVALEFTQSQSALASLIRESKDTKSGLLLVVDQLEEMFTFEQTDKTVAEQFAKLLRETLEDLDVRFYLLTTIRSDFLSHFSQLPQLEELLASGTNRYYLPTLSTAGLKTIMEGPSKVAHFDWESGLVERLVVDIAASHGGLPVIAHVLYALWTTRQHNLLTHRSYDALGGVAGSLALSADSVVDRLPPDAQLLVKKALLCLVKATPNDVYVRRNASRSEVLEAMGGGARAEAVLTYLSGGRTSELPGSSTAFMRVVTITIDALQNRVDLVHEALIREWPKFKEWIKEDAAELRRRDALEGSANAWVSAGCPKNDLPTGAQLDYLKGGAAYTELARKFLDAAIGRAKRVRRIKQCVVGGIAILLFVLYVLGCDLGVRFPGAQSLRVLMDERGFSLFRPLAPIKSVHNEVHNLRLELLSMLKSRWKYKDSAVDGQISTDYDKSLGTDAWATRQSIASMLSCQECSTDPAVIQWAQAALNTAFATDSMRFDSNGHDYGWIRNDQLQVTMTEPVVWMQIGVARAFADPMLTKDANGEPMKSWLVTTETILEQYRSSDGVTLNSFPRQIDRSEVGMYPTVMMLMALLETRSSRIPNDHWRNIDERIRQLDAWLCEHFDSSGGGWRAMPGGEVLDSFTFQIYAALLRAEHDVGIAIPKRILDAIPVALARTNDRSYGDSLDEIHYGTKYVDEKGVTVSANEDIVLIWHPWAVQVAWRWLERTQSSKHPNSRDIAIARRALTHLVIEMAPEIIKRARQTYTYEVAETLYAMSTL